MASNLKSGKQAAIMRKTKSSSGCIMGGRTQEIRPVGAWVQPEFGNAPDFQEAVFSAQIEEAKTRRQLIEKEEKLRRFQEDVKRRVQAHARARRKNWMASSYKAMEQEGHVVQQSAVLSEKVTPRKNRCKLRTDSHLAIRPQSAPPVESLGSSADQESLVTGLEKQSKRVHQTTDKARRHLMSRRILTENFVPDDLPGGAWKMGSTLDNPVSRSMNEPEAYTEEVDEESVTEEEPAVRVVHFDKKPSPEESRKHRILQKSVASMSGTELHRPLSVPNIYPGVTSEDEKRQAVSQRALYRRLFMDIEREQVKENIRRQEHRKKIAILKKTKEEERKQIEAKSHELVEPKDPITGESEKEAAEREAEARERLRASFQEEQQRAQKARESERYLEALKRHLVEKIEKRNIQLPPLCCCGDTIWDTNPETCANNCVFYKNPKAYAKALQSLLVSCDAV